MSNAASHLWDEHRKLAATLRHAENDGGLLTQEIPRLRLAERVARHRAQYMEVSLVLSEYPTLEPDWPNIRSLIDHEGLPFTLRDIHSWGQRNKAWERREEEKRREENG